MYDKFIDGQLILHGNRLTRKKEIIKTMTKEEKKKYFLKTLANNDMVQLYGIDGMSLDLDFQHHICFSISYIPLIGNSLERRIFGLLAVIYLATIWKIYLAKSFYPKKYVLAVQVEAEWILGKRLVPPLMLF